MSEVKNIAAKNDEGFEIIKIFLQLLYTMPGCWGDGVTDVEYKKIAKYLIKHDPEEYGDMLEGLETW